ncbi:MAG: glutathione synthase [Kangiellaceae bacterium]|nr:glutathione synthase [Kangiellaceae bacterium]
MSHSLLMIMDPIESINIKKDTSFGFLLEAQRRGWQLFYCQPQDLSLENNQVVAECSNISVANEVGAHYQVNDLETRTVSEFSTVFMRKDPPFDMDYIYSTYLLELAQEAGTLVVNHPRSLRDCNEKLFTAWFPQFTPKTLVSANKDKLKAFIAKQQDVILKPLDGMGGASIFKVKASDPNVSVIIETLTAHGQQLAMAQQFIPEIVYGDKRILVVIGQVIPYTLARIPSKGETRGNLAAGGSGVPMPITEAEKAIAEQIAPELMKRGLYFVGLDMIGEYVTEINVTSPTCMRELENEFEINIAGILFDAIEQKISS